MYTYCIRGATGGISECAYLYSDKKYSDRDFMALCESIPAKNLTELMFALIGRGFVSRHVPVYQMNQQSLPVSICDIVGPKPENCHGTGGCSCDRPVGSFPYVTADCIPSLTPSGLTYYLSVNDDR